MDKFKNKYRIPSARLQAWDYGRNGIYFITICTQNRETYFGKIVNGYMELSNIGLIANKYWGEIPEHFPFVNLNEFVVMPNHIHGIIEIAKTNNEHNVVETPNLGVSTNIDTEHQTAASSEKWKPQSLGVIINQFKRIVTIQSHKIHADFAWQSRFYDHIIRNNKSYEKIKNYIINNPQKWNDDKLNSLNK